MELQPLKPGEVEAFTRTAKHLENNAEICGRARKNMQTQRPVLLGISGWPGSGKDVLGKKVMEKLGGTTVQLRFSAAIREEANEIIDACRGTTHQKAAENVKTSQNVSWKDAQKAVDIIHEAAQNPETTSRSRTTPVRKLLQEWATDVRRRENGNYWVYKALAPAIHAIAENKNVYIADVRFENEIEVARSLGFVLVRLDVTAATVKERLLKRDGLEINDEELQRLLQYPTESSLDNYNGFDLRFRNEGTIESGVDVITSFIKTGMQTPNTKPQNKTPKPALS